MPRLDLAAVLLTVLTVLTAPSALSAQCPDGAPPPCRGTARPAARAPGANSVAVLMVSVLSGDSADNEIAEGLGEEITDRLGGIERLQVKSRGAVLRVRDETDPGVAGRALGVRYVVESSLRRVGGERRVSVRLVRVEDGFRVWGNVFDASGNLLVMQEQIAREVASGIAGRLVPGEVATLASNTGRSPQAYEHFLRGHALLARRDPVSVARAVEEYQAAVRLDPAFSGAAARLAYALALYVSRQYDSPIRHDSAVAWARTATDRALLADPGAAEAWLARGLLATDPTGREQVAATARAVTLDPRNAEARHSLSAQLALQGDVPGGIAEAERALGLDPSRRVTLANLADWQWRLGRVDLVPALTDSLVVMDSTMAQRALFQATIGDTAALRREVVRLRRVGADVSLFDSMLAFRAGRPGAARSVFAELDSALAPGAPALAASDSYQASWVAVLFGDPERAIALLEKVRPRDRGLLFVLGAPGLAAIRSDPRIVRLIEECRRNMDGAR